MALPKVEALESLARQLHEQLRLHGVKAALHYVNTFVYPARRNCSGLLSFVGDFDKLFDLFLGVCEKMNLYSPLVISYLSTGPRWESAAEDKEFCFALQLLDKKSAELFLEHALEMKEWIFVLLILHSRPWMEPSSALETMTRHTYMNSYTFSVAQMMLKRGSIRKHILSEIMAYFIKVGDLSLFQFVLKNSIIPLNEVIGIGTSCKKEDGYVLVPVLSMILHSFDRLGPLHFMELRNMLVMALENGLSTYHAAFTARYSLSNVQSSLETAAIQGRVDVVQLLYRTGATTNAEVFEVKNFLDEFMDDLLTDDDEDTQAMGDIHQYLSQAARRTRRLRELCILRISHAIGCRSLVDRDAAVSNLFPLPPEPLEESSDNVKYTLKDKVLFRDVLLDFELGTSHRAKDRDPLENISQ